MTIDYAIIGWAAEHWWLAFWLALWALVLGTILAITLINGARFLINRPLRTIKVLCRGWPPAHLDADGDWRPVPKEPEYEFIDERPIVRGGVSTLTRIYRRKS